MARMLKTGLFFGSFNPVHLGHLMIANYMAEFTDLDQVWFVVSPQNPLKESTSLLPDYQRLEMVKLAIGEDERFRVTDIEFRLPKPSFTIDTLSYLREKHPAHEFILISGTDIFPSFTKWKNWEVLLSLYKFYVYPRPGSDKHQLTHHNSVTVFPAPRVEISSTFIRKAIRDGHDVSHFLPDQVWKYLKEMHFYEK